MTCCHNVPLGQAQDSIFLSYNLYLFNRLEMERVLPQLKIIVKSDNRDWRAHLEQIKTLRTNIESVSNKTFCTAKEIKLNI